MNRDSIIIAEHISKKYRRGVIGGKTLRDDISGFFSHRGEEKSGEFLALDDVSFEIGRGEKVAVIGGNGAGKSTLLRLLARITAPTSGDIYLGGRVSSILQIGTGFHNELTGRENAYLNGTILGMSRREIDGVIDDIIAFSECEEFIDTPVKRYSSGMFVKLAFAVAAYLNNDILIMDEVLAVGDVRFQQKCLSKLSEIAAQGNRTILFVSHNMSSVRQLCPRAMVLREGKLIFDGDTTRGIEHYMNISKSGERIFRFSRENRIGGLSMPEAILKAELLPSENKKTPVRLTICAGEEVSEAGICFAVCSADNQPIGTASAKQPVFLKKGVETEITLCLDLTPIQEGIYPVNIALYAEMGGRKLALDKVNNAFVINNPAGDSRHKLNQATFGAVTLPDAELMQNDIL